MLGPEAVGSETKLAPASKASIGGLLDVPQAWRRQGKPLATVYQRWFETPISAARSGNFDFSRDHRDFLRAVALDATRWSRSILAPKGVPLRFFQKS